MLSRVSSLWMRLQKACCLEDKCNFHNSTRIKCSFVVKEADNIVENIGLNIYKLYSPCDGGVPKSIRSEGKQLIIPHPGHLFSQHKSQQTWPKVQREETGGWPRSAVRMKIDPTGVQSIQGRSALIILSQVDLRRMHFILIMCRRSSLIVLTAYRKQSTA
uniref:lysosomal protective protein-like isoform X1 n=2 Tax=Myxine glutinosa TaxID=7769 RepID=UPI00358F48BC